MAFKYFVFQRTWWILLQKRLVRLPAYLVSESYYRNASCGFQRTWWVNLITETPRAAFSVPGEWILFQKRLVRLAAYLVSESYSRNVSCVLNLISTFSLNQIDSWTFIGTHLNLHITMTLLCKNHSFHSLFALKKIKKTLQS